ncbi:MAG TPA: presenilin family intramembrane aspartyl protease [Candidatus Acidoferrum sp.]|nr:presenilin family intramembrane aspartyl protease [Candidatus Acidoferrum sp.]
MPLRVIETRQVAQILIMFMIVQFFGLFLASQVFSGATYQQISGAQVVSSSVSVLFYVVYIILLSALLIFLFKIVKGDKLFIVIEGAVVFIASFFVFLILSGIFTTSTLFYISGSAITTNFLIGAVAAILLVIAKNKMQRLRNATAIIASVGVGLVLGISFSFFATVIFMMILAVYDFVAVFITKHMVTMARAMSSRNLAFLVGVNEVEAIPKSSFSSKELADYKKENSGVKKSPALSQFYRSGMLPVVARIELGTGDLAVPLMVAVAAYKVSLNFVLSFFVIFGAVLGLLMTAFILRKYKRALPAIPPLLFGVAIGLSAYVFIFNVLHL